MSALQEFIIAAVLVRACRSTDAVGSMRNSGFGMWPRAPSSFRDKHRGVRGDIVGKGMGASYKGLEARRDASIANKKAVVAK